MANERQLSYLFQDENGRPAGFFLHKSIKNAFQRETLTREIVRCGGKILDNESGADTVLVDEKGLAYPPEALQTNYSISRDELVRNVVVEPMKFVQNCIRRQDFSHRLPERFAMGGYVGRRTPFTTQDDDNLCWYLSRRIPDPEAGGRLSTGVYRELMQAAEQGHANWAKRHTVESWRERYKKNRGRLDLMIEKYAKRHPPEPPALYGLSRHLNKNPQRARRFVKEDDDDVIELSDSSEGDFDEEPLQQRLSDADVGPSKPSKRPRIESSNTPSPTRTPGRSPEAQPSSTGRTRLATPSHSKGGGKEVEPGWGTPVPRTGSLFAPGFLEPDPSQIRRQPRSIHQDKEQNESEHAPPPTATLVNQPSPTLQPPPTTPPSSRHARQPISPLPHLSTSFRDVPQSSPLFVGSRSANRSDAKSYNTSRTEPSSRSIVVPAELALPEHSHHQAESSITRESSHKQSSPIPPPMRMAARGHPSRRPPVAPVSDVDEGSGWAPYKNTRSRSHSVEPVPLQITKKRRGRSNNLLRKDAPLDPVHEGEVEHEAEHERNVRGDVSKRERDTISSTVMTETMQEEQNVVDLLIVDPSDTSRISGAPTRESEDDEKDDDDEDTEDEGEGEKMLIGKKEEEEEGETGREEHKGQATPTVPEGKSSKASEDQGSREGPDDREEVPRIPSSSPHHPTRSNFRRQTLESDDAQTDGMIKSAQRPAEDTPVKNAREVLRLYDSSPEDGTSPFSRRGQERPSSNPSGSARPLRAYNQNRLQQSPLTSKLMTGTGAPARQSARATAGLPQQSTTQRQGPRVSFDPPSGRGSLPRTPTRHGDQLPRSQRPHRGSVESSSSDTSSFPIHGTRASAIKQRLEQEMKQSPYAPPPGTKAAQVVTARERRQKRQRG